MEPISVWVAVGVFAVIAGGQPSINVQAADEMFDTKALCDARQAEVRVRAKSPPAGIVVAALGTECVLVKVEELTSPSVREFTPDEKRGITKGAI